MQLNTQVSNSNRSLMRIDLDNQEFVEHFQPKIFQAMYNVGDNAFALEYDIINPANNSAPLFQPTEHSRPNINKLVDGYFLLEIEKNEEPVAESLGKEFIEEIVVQTEID